jgi:Ni,Fe-hydrogenase III large subunit
MSRDYWDEATLPALSDLIDLGEQIPYPGRWARANVTPLAWDLAAQRLAEGTWSLLGLWGERSAVHMALRDEAAGTIGIVSLDAPDGHYPAISRLHRPALRLERTIHDLFGLTPHGMPDTRPWLDHGAWGVSAPLGAREAAPEVAAPYVFLESEGDGLHQIPVGPVHAGIIEPGHFRFTANGETVVRLEERLGYVHKGVEGLMEGASLQRAARLAARLSGDSAVAFAYAFALAAESAVQTDIPARAVWLRALMGELERLANHFGDIGAICNDASFALMHAHCGVLREEVLRSADAAFGHRSMRDCIAPGGVERDIAAQGIASIRALLGEARRRFPHLVRIYDNTASLQDRTVSTGVLRPELARRYGAGGYVGRASGRAFDARGSIGYAPYDQLSFDIPVLSEGDVNARVWIRIREVEQSLALIEQILDRLPNGAVRVDLPRPGEPREGMALVEGFRGEVLVWLRLGADGLVERCHLRDPSWFQWPLLEVVIEGNIVADFPLCNKSFNCSYSGCDL